MRGFSFCAKIWAELGEYAKDQGFLPPKLVSAHREYPRSRFRVEWCAGNFKNEGTWYRVLVDF